MPGKQEQDKIGAHRWGGGSRHEQSITHLLVMTVISSLRTSSGHCGPRSDFARPPLLHPWPPSMPLGERGTLLFLTDPFLLPALNQPLVLLSAKLQPQDTTVSRSLLGRGKIGEGEGRRDLLYFYFFSSHPEAVCVSDWLFVDCGLFTTTSRVSAPHPAPNMAGLGLCCPPLRALP